MTEKLKQVIIPTADGGSHAIDLPSTEEMERKLAGKVDKIDGKGLSSNDFTDTDKSQLYSGTINAQRLTGYINSNVRILAHQVSSGTLGGDGVAMSIPCKNLVSGLGLPDDTWKAIQSKGIDGQYVNDGTIPSDAIANGVISGDKIAEGGISGYNIGLYQISHNHLASGFGQLFGVYSGYGSGLWVNGSKIAPNSIPGSAIGNFAIQSYNIAQSGIVSWHIKENQIGYAHLSTGVDGLQQMFVLTGGAAYLNANKFQTASIPYYAISNYAIRSFHVATGAIQQQHITSGAIHREHMDRWAITGCFVDGTQLADRSIPTVALSNKCVTSEKLADGCVEPNHFGSRFMVSGVYLTGNLPENIVTGGALADNEIGNSKMINEYYPRIRIPGVNISGAIPVDNVREAVEAILTEYNLIPAQTI